MATTITATTITATVIQAHGLVFAYPGVADPVVRGLSFDVERGEIFGFLGPSGAGKSTTQKILIGLLDDYQGSVKVLGTEVSSWRGDDYERIGVAFEAPTHFLKLTALENLRYFARLYSIPGDAGGTPTGVLGTRTPRDPRQLLAELDLADGADQAVSQFSKGMKTRLGIARALLHDPDLIFLDEPTGGLDPVNGRRIRDLIRRERDAGKTIFLTTHDMMVADELCDRVALIVDGTIQAIDTPRALKLAHGRRRVRVEYRESGASEPRNAEFDLDGLGENGDFADLLRRHRIETIHTEEATLEDVFVAVTGRSLAS